MQEASQPTPNPQDFLNTNLENIPTESCFDAITGQNFIETVNVIIDSGRTNLDGALRIVGLSIVDILRETLRAGLNEGKPIKTVECNMAEVIAKYLSSAMVYQVSKDIEGRGDIPDFLPELD